MISIFIEYVKIKTFLTNWYNLVDFLKYMLYNVKVLSLTSNLRQEGGKAMTSYDLLWKLILLLLAGKSKEEEQKEDKG